MRTRSQTRNRNRQQQAQPAVVQPFHLEEPFDNPPLVPMADNRTMAQLLQAPTEGYEDAIVIPEINANFELKHGTLPSNTIPNPKGEMKAITTRSGVAYEGPSIPTNHSPKKEVPAQISPPVIPISIPELDVPTNLPKTTPILEPDIPKSLPKPDIPYPSRRDNQKSHDKASNQMEKIF
ncbi:hypothetical protein Tco_0573075 [Tanacetum coccineum]